MPPDDSPARRPRVFVLDSEPALLGVMRRLLEDEQYDVTTSSFVPASFETIAAVPPSLLIVDLALHERAGWELLEHLAIDAITRGIPVIVTSTDPRLLDRAGQSRNRFGGEAWITKPVDVHILLDEVIRLIRSA